MSDEDFKIFFDDFRSKFIEELQNIISKAIEELDKEYSSKRAFFGEIQESIARYKAKLDKLYMPKWTWNPDAIRWEKAQGASGEYERSEDVNNPEFKALLKDLAVHNGKISRDGWFYWTFHNGATVGRKKRKNEG